jgi:4-hydroxybenzoyl-CoA reductase subunit alpha
LGEYKIPTALDMPNVRSIIVESNEPNGPYGAKEVGEGAIMPTIPAILNAIYDATGVRINELPVTSEKLFMALVEKNRIV